MLHNSTMRMSPDSLPPRESGQRDYGILYIQDLLLHMKQSYYCQPVTILNTYNARFLLPLRLIHVHVARMCVCVCITQREVSRQRKSNNSTTPQLRKEKRAALGEIQIHGTLLSRQALYQLSYQGNSAGRGSNLQHSATQGIKANYCAMAQYSPLTQHVGALFPLSHAQVRT